MKINIKKNHIICGDNVDWLKDVPDESVDLCYIDPPFYSNKDREVLWGNGYELRAFGDRFAGGISHYIEWMRPRIELIHKKLKSTGSIFLHCDWHASHRLRCVLEDVFGEDNIRNEIIWRRANAHNDPGRCGIITDTILFYAKSNKPKWNPVHTSYSEKYLASHWGKKDKDGRRFRLVPLDAPRHGNGGNLVYEWKGKLPAPSRTWSCTKDKMIELEKQGKILYTKTGTPNLKRYVDETSGLPLQNLWDDIPPVNPMAKERLGYPTQKPEALIKRIFECASDEGDLILDCFAGGGTSAKVAADMKRRFIVGDVSPVAIKIMSERLYFDCPETEFEVKNLPQTEGELKKMNGHEFAEVVCDVMGWEVNTKKSGDGGIDAWAGDVHPVQIKNHSKSAAGRPDMQKFFGALAKEKAKKGIFVAWEFSKDAMGFIADMKRDHKIEIVPMKCNEVFGGLLLDPSKGAEIEKLYKERYPKEWAAKKKEDASASETKRVLEKAKVQKQKSKRGASRDAG